MKLRNAQADFISTMLNHPAAVEDPQDDFAALFNEGDIPLPARLKVYRNNIVGGLTDTITTSFPILDALVGRDFLEALARSFILKNPPTQGCLNTYGRGIDAFIRHYAPARGLPYLADVAAFEIAMTESYYAPNDAPLTAQALGGIAPEALSEVVLALRRSARLLSSPYPLTAIRDFCQKNDDDSDEHAQLDLDQGGVNIIVYRPHLEVLIVSAAPEEFALLKRLEAGAPLGSAVEQTLGEHPDFQFQPFLQKHIELETFQALAPHT